MKVVTNRIRNLHSTMVLFKSMPKQGVSSTFNLFTFHYGSIQINIPP